MAPVKFDDISKVSNDVISNDYVAGFQMKAKQKTSWQGAEITSVVDLFPKAEGKDACMTPAKLTWKFPTPLGVNYVCVDKLEMDKSGKFKLECSSDKVQVPGLKLSLTSDLVDMGKISTSCTYTGVKDMQIKLDTKATKPQDFTAEVTKAQGLATVGVKCTAATLTAPDLGMRLAQGPFFCSLLVKEKFKVYTAQGSYKATPDIHLAGTYEYGGKKNGNFSFGLLYNVMKGVALRCKVSQDQSVQLGVKSEVTKGFNVLFGCKYEKGKELSHGLHVSVE
jgi:hypothetical protein